jgi:hypothetical protein
VVATAPVEEAKELVVMAEPTAVVKSVVEAAVPVVEG